jgi:hypothetical protein
MQDKKLLYFPRACIYAIYGDQPAATKCALTGSACPVCYTKECDMAATKTCNLVYRWDEDMALKKKNYKKRRRYYALRWSYTKYYFNTY